MEIDLESFTDMNTLDALRFIDITSNVTDKNRFQLVKMSDGNLLYINSYLDYCRMNKSCEFSKVPKTLEFIYYVNLKRIFGEKGTSFEEWIALFEVLCAASNPIDIDDLFLIAGLVDEKQKRKFNRLQGSEFAHFLKQSDRKLSFQHKAFREFLTNESGKHMPFYINITKGHVLFSNYNLQIQVPQNRHDEKVLVDVASHVALTYNKKIANKFLQFYRTRLKDSKILIILARDVNCYDTTNLVIQLINQSGLSSSNMSDAAFIASANGNFKTLTSFLENKVNIKSKYNLALEQLMKGADLVHMCKYVFFCGYNIFHIAAQRGYVEIVNYLLKNYPEILYENNNIQLNAFQLAAENGHTKIVKLFLDINSSLADHYSLYYASQQGHDGIVSLLLNYVNDTCLPCNGTIYWLPTYSIRKQKNVTFPIEALDKRSVYFQNLGFILFDKTFKKLKNAILSDDWRLITCESALNAAVRNGHLRIVKSFLEEEVNALHCTMFDGSTPLLTAAKYDQAAVFRYLYDSGGNLAGRCLRNFSYEGKFEKTVLDKILERICPENGSISHLLAIYNSYGIITFLMNKGFNDLDTVDGNGLTPSHYAFCLNSNNFIEFVVFTDTAHLNLNITSPNGSTPYHSAAICKSHILSHYVDTTIRRLLDKVDNENRGILHYGLIPSVSKEDAIQIDRVGKDYFSDLLVRVAINNKHDYLRVDNDGRNILHFAASSGNYWVFMEVLQILKKCDINKLLYCKDKSGYTPLKAAFNSLTPRQAFESLKIPPNCSLIELFSTTCNAKLSVILLPHEYFIFTVSKYLSSTNYFIPSNVKDYLILAINKSRIYPILVLKTYSPNEFNVIVSSSTEIPNLLAKSDMHIIAEYIFNADNSLRCSKTESPLHQLVVNAMNGQNIFPLNFFIDHLFKKFSSQYLDQCYDKDGYNLLHKAAMGGNIETVELMLTKGMNISCPSKNDHSALELCIYSSPFLKNGYVPS
ncbi:ANKRD50 [Mytilus coruscus]|uniref:ANKRD50 n=1 Tax=Mytilus coruscus TaxID=42192 RepID=A0A6J8ACE5_MYTCO|nr:ANKRD50 [Mytilus coruscus]